MKRREVYATTGTRLRVRVFGGWDFAEEEVYLPGFAKLGYTRGVPMGGDLSSAPKAQRRPSSSTPFGIPMAPISTVSRW